MKKVALISSFCDSEQKLQVLEKNINTVKSLGIDTIVISPFSLPDNIVNQCTYFFKTNDNPILDWPEHSMFIWLELYINNELYRLTRTYADYGWAGLYQVKQLSEIALLLKYDQFFHMIYDLKIDNNVLNGLMSNKTCNIYPSKRNDDVWKSGLHFMIFDRENLERFISYIHLDSYLSLRCGDAFSWLESLNNIFPFKNEKIPVEDEIYYYHNHDFFNYSPINDFKMFVVKDDEELDEIKLLFYSVKEPKPIQIIVDDFVINDFTYQHNIVNLGFNKLNPKNVKLLYNGNEYDITDTISKIKHNTFRLK